MMPSQPALIRVEGLSKVYGRGSASPVRAVDSISFEIFRGETLALVGESGCGKSTTGRLLMRLIEPSEGKIEFDGNDLLSLRKSELRRTRRRLQFIFQDPHSAFNPRMTVEQIISEPMVLAGASPGECRERVQEVLPLVGLSAEHARRYPHQFSGGQRQRIGIARALGLRPEFVVCDEPVSALDVSVQAQVINLLTDLQGEFGLTYLFISHDLRVVRHIADRVAVMYLGRIVELADNRLLFAEPRHPYTKLLLSAVPRLEARHAGHVAQAEVVEVGNSASSAHGCAFANRCPYVSDSCREMKPPLRDTGDGRYVACHHPVSP